MRHVLFIGLYIIAVRTLIIYSLEGLCCAAAPVDADPLVHLTQPGAAIFMDTFAGLPYNRSARSKPTSPRAIGGFTGAHIGAFRNALGYATDSNPRASFIRASNERCTYIRSRLLCPGVRGAAYEHLY